MHDIIMITSIRKLPHFFFFFFNDTATTEIYTLSLHDALPIAADHGAERGEAIGRREGVGRCEIDLVLARRDLVMQGLGIEVHVLEHLGDGAPDLLAPLPPLQVEVTAPVRGPGGCPGAVRPTE